MPSDLITLRPLALELNDTLAGGKVDKVNMPESDEVRLVIRAGGKNHTLLMSCNPTAPRIHLTQTKKENPQVPPAFCMHLRKYLLSSTVVSVMPQNDRVIKLTFSGRNELMDVQSYHLYVEIMNRYSNIIFTTSDDVVTSAIKTVGIEDSSRPVMSGLKYAQPVQNKVSLDDFEAVKALVMGYDGDNLKGFLTKNLNGVAGITVSEILNRADFDGKITRELAQKIAEQAKAFYNAYGTDLFAPCTDEKGTDFFLTPYGEGKYLPAETLSQAADSVFSATDKRVRTLQKTKRLNDAAKRFKEKQLQKIDLCNQKLAECERSEEYKIKGELLLANAWKIKKGDKFVEVENWYENGNPTLKISLDERKSAGQNADAFFKKYAKLKRAREITSEQKVQAVELADYADGILEALSRAEPDRSLFDFEDELTKIGALRLKKTTGKKAPKQPPSGPYVYNFKGTEIIAGKNNLQNENATFKLASPSDIWLHVKNEHGSHVVIKSDSPSDEVVVFAAEIAAALSSASMSDKVEVDFTNRKFVKRIPGKLLGRVNYTNHQTVTVKPDKHESFLV